MSAALLVLALTMASTTVEVSGDVEATIAYGAASDAVGAVAAVTVAGDRITIAPPAGAPRGELKVSLGAKVDRIVARGGAHVIVTGFAGKTLEVDASGGAHVTVSAAKGASADKVSVDGAGTSRIDLDGVSAETGDVKLKDAARAEVKITKTLTCDLQRASRLAVKGNPKVDKKIAGVAKLELK